MRFIRRGNIDVAQDWLPRVKNLAHICKEFMLASELDAYRRKFTLPDGSIVDVNIAGGIDNITIYGAKKEFKPEELLPEDFYDQVLIWVGIRNKEIFPLESFQNLSLVWRSPIFDTAILPLDELFSRRLLFIFAPKRPFNPEELRVVKKWVAAGGKVIIQLGETHSTSSARGSVNSMLVQLGSPIRLQDMWAGLEYNLTYYSSSGPSLRGYSGYTEHFKFLTKSGGFIANGGPHSITFTPSKWDRLDPEGKPYAFKGPVPLMYRGRTSWPRFCTNGSVPFLQYWIDNYEPDLEWSEEQVQEIIDLYQQDGWFWSEPLAAYYGNVMALCWGPTWFTHSLIWESYFQNIPFMIEALIKEWGIGSTSYPLSPTYWVYNCFGIGGFLQPIQYEDPQPGIDDPENPYF